MNSSKLIMEMKDITLTGSLDKAGGKILDFKSFRMLESAPAPEPVTLNTSTESIKMRAVYDKSRGGVIRLEGKKGPKDYKISVKIPLIYTGPVQPVKLTKELTQGGKSAEYTIWTNVDGQSHTIDRSDAIQLADLYNGDGNSMSIGRATFTRTWKYKDLV